MEICDKKLRDLILAKIVDDEHRQCNKSKVGGAEGTKMMKLGNATNQKSEGLKEQKGDERWQCNELKVGGA